MEIKRNFMKKDISLVNSERLIMYFVGCGLDSQIIGDFEIIGQLKKSFYNSKSTTLSMDFQRG